jgi:hypothetical protein
MPIGNAIMSERVKIVKPCEDAFDACDRPGVAVTIARPE